MNYLTDRHLCPSPPLFDPLLHGPISHGQSLPYYQTTPTLPAYPLTPSALAPPLVPVGPEVMQPSHATHAHRAVYTSRSHPYAHTHTHAYANSRLKGLYGSYSDNSTS